jgi:hypothetical protein
MAIELCKFLRADPPRFWLRTFSGVFAGSPRFWMWAVAFID